MSHPLIYTELRWLPKLLDVLLTLLAWGGFLWLIYRGFMLTLQESSYFGNNPALGTFGSILSYFVLIIIGSLALVFWAKYNQYRYHHERRQRRSGLTLKELAESLEVDQEIMSRAHTARTQIFHHDESGCVEKAEIIS